MNGKKIHCTASILSLFAIILAGAPLRGQATDPTTGHVKSEGNWLILGPFSQPFACGTVPEDLLTLALAPSSVHLLAPEEGEAVDYDPAQASTLGYLGPTSDPAGRPEWRVFYDGSDDGDIDLDADVNSNQCRAVSFLATYVEYRGAGTAEIFFCVKSDDSVQVWWDEKLVHNQVACRGRDAPERCQDVAGPVTATPGIHRIALGIWEGWGGWGGSLGLQRPDGSPILDGDSGWIFLGTDPAGFRISEATFPRRELSLPGDPATCPPPTTGPVKVRISQPLGGKDPVEPVAVKETALGIFGAASILNASPRPAIAVKTAVGTLRPLGLFADWKAIVLNPDCSGRPGESSASHDPAAGSYTLKNIGEDIWQNGDSFTYAYAKVKGDFVITAHVKDRYFVPGSRWGKHGVMTRQDTNPRSRYSFVHDQGEDPQDETRWACRPTHGGSDNYETTAIGPGEHHDWLRIERAGSLFAGYSWDGASVDGDGKPRWIRLGEQDWGGSAPEAVLAGLAVTSHTTGCEQAPTAIGFDQVALELGPGAEIVPPGSDPLGVELSWEVRREELAAGLSYELDLQDGIANFKGTAGEALVLGDGFARVSSAAAADRPIDLEGDGRSEFDHAHFLGHGCPVAEFEQPATGKLEIISAGNAIWTEAEGDRFAFAYREISGDFSAQATIAAKEFAPGSRWGTIAIMARQDCTFRSTYSMIYDSGADPQDGTRFAYRPSTGQGCTFMDTQGALSQGSHFNTLRLDRCGTEFIGYVLDTEGLAGPACEWVEIARSDWGPEAPEKVLLGLAVASNAGCAPVTAAIENWRVDPACGGASVIACKVPIANLTCRSNDAGGLELAWENAPFAETAIPISIRVNGQEALSVPGSATAAAVPPEALAEGASRIEVVNYSGTARQCGFFKGDELALNCGGPRLAPGLGAQDIGDGRAWEEDTLLNPSPFLASPNAHTADFSIGFKPAFKTADTTLTAPEFIDHPARSRLFATERWDDGDIRYRVNVPKGNYEVALLFAEGCCSEGCEDLPDPQDSAGGCRVFDILVNGALVGNQFAQHVEAQRRLEELGKGNPLPNSDWGIALAMGPYAVKDASAIDIAIQDLGGGNPPENASIKGILVKRVKEPPAPRFRRGDVDASGAVDISDPINELHSLFLGDFAITCQDAADFDDSGEVDISDAINSLLWQFASGTLAPPPGPFDCGVDPTADKTAPDIGCAAYAAGCP